MVDVETIAYIALAVAIAALALVFYHHHLSGSVALGA
jgi:hypothetical protein